MSYLLLSGPDDLVVPLRKFCRLKRFAVIIKKCFYFIKLRFLIFRVIRMRNLILLTVVWARLVVLDLSDLDFGGEGRGIIFLLLWRIGEREKVREGEGGSRERGRRIIFFFFNALIL